MNIIKTLNNKPIKFIDSWFLPIKYAKNAEYLIGIDTLCKDNGELIFVCWKHFKNETTLW